MVYIFLALIFYSSIIIFGTFASRAADIRIVTAIENLLSAVIPVLTVIPILNKTSYQNQKLGILAAVAAGVLIALFTIFINKAYSVNKVAIVAPIVFGGSIFLSAILSYFIFKEKVSLFQGIGLTFLAIGLIIVTYSRFTGK